MNGFEKQHEFIRAICRKNGVSKRLFSLTYRGQYLDSSQLEVRIIPLSSTAGWDSLEAVYEIDPGVLRLRMNVRIYRDFPIVECLPRLENPGRQNSGIVEKFYSLDLPEDLPPQPVTNHFPAGTNLEVRYHLGSFSDLNDFIAQKRKLWSRPGSHQIVLDNHEGRSSSNFLPYFGVDIDELNGMNFGIGWSGAWRSSVEMLIYPGPYWHATRYRVAISMQETHFYVQPGETLQQIGFFIHFRSGQTVREAQNEHRRFMITYHAPHDSKGNLLEPPISLVTWGGLATDKMLDRIEAIKKHQLPYEVFWVDAGWSGFPGPCPHFLDEAMRGKSDWPIRVGNWDINRIPHPGGLRPVSEAARTAGLRFLSWFEPERVHTQSKGKILIEHPEWLHGLEGSSHRLLNLGDPEALEYIFQTISQLIEEQGIDLYREDFNIDPFPIWKSMDASDRLGVAEMKHVAGHYELWEKLHRKFPDMPFDNCASGGRRLDYLSLTYSFPLCQSDYACFTDYDREGIQTENFYLSDWVPLHAGFTWLPDHDPYDFLSCAGSGISSKIWSFDSREVPSDDACDWDYHRTMLQQVRRMRAMQLAGNVYPLTIEPENLVNWCVRQVHVPKKDEGYVLAFRRTRSPVAQMSFPLFEIESDATYILQDFNGKEFILPGSELKSGFQIQMPAPRSVTLIYYRKQSPNFQHRRHHHEPITTTPLHHQEIHTH